jgi:hypothetical protein
MPVLNQRLPLLYEVLQHPWSPDTVAPAKTHYGAVKDSFPLHKVRKFKQRLSVEMSPPKAHSYAGFPRRKYVTREFPALGKHNTAVNTMDVDLNHLPLCAYAHSYLQKWVQPRRTGSWHVCSYAILAVDPLMHVHDGKLACEIPQNIPELESLR